MSRHVQFPRVQSSRATRGLCCVWDDRRWCSHPAQQGACAVCGTTGGGAVIPHNKGPVLCVGRQAVVQSSRTTRGLCCVWDDRRWCSHPAQQGACAVCGTTGGGAVIPHNKGPVLCVGRQAVVQSSRATRGLCCVWDDRRWCSHPAQQGACAVCGTTGGGAVIPRNKGPVLCVGRQAASLACLPLQCAGVGTVCLSDPVSLCVCI